MGKRVYPEMTTPFGWGSERPVCKKQLKEVQTLFPFMGSRFLRLEDLKNLEFTDTRYLGWCRLLKAKESKTQITYYCLLAIYWDHKDNYEVKYRKYVLRKYFFIGGPKDKTFDIFSEKDQDKYDSYALVKLKVVKWCQVALFLDSDHLNVFYKTHNKKLYLNAK